MQCTIHLDKFWSNQEVKYDFTADLTWTGNRSEEVLKSQSFYWVRYIDADIRGVSTYVRNVLLSWVVSILSWIFCIHNMNFVLVLIEIVQCFNETRQNDPSISEAIAAIQTLLEVIKRSNGELHIVSNYSLFCTAPNRFSFRLPLKI